MLSESQKRIFNQELLRKLILNEVKHKHSKREYQMVVENYDYFLHEAIATPNILLNEGLGDWFKGAFAGIKAKLKPDDQKEAAAIEAQVKQLLQKAARMRKDYAGLVQADKQMAEKGVEQGSDREIELAKMKQEARKLEAEAQELSNKLNNIRSKNNLKPIKFFIDDATGDMKKQELEILAPDDGKLDPAGAGAAPTEGGPDQGPNSQGEPDGPEKIGTPNVENPNAKSLFGTIKSIWGSLKTTYDEMFKMPANFAKAVNRGFNQAQNAPVNRQDDIMLKILDLLIAQALQQKVPIGDKVKKTAEKAKDIVDDDNKGGPDSDGDGTPDAEEKEKGTDPNDPKSEPPEEGEKEQFGIPLFKVGKGMGGKSLANILRKELFATMQQMKQNKQIEKVDTGKIEQVIKAILKDLSKHLKANNLKTVQTSDPNKGKKEKGEIKQAEPLKPADKLKPADALQEAINRHTYKLFISPNSEITRRKNSLLEFLKDGLKDFIFEGKSQEVKNKNNYEKFLDDLHQIIDPSLAGKTMTPRQAEKAIKNIFNKKQFKKLDPEDKEELETLKQTAYKVYKLGQEEREEVQQKIEAAKGDQDEKLEPQELEKIIDDSGGEEGGEDEEKDTEEGAEEQEEAKEYKIADYEKKLNAAFMKSKPDWSEEEFADTLIMALATYVQDEADEVKLVAEAFIRGDTSWLLLEKYDYEKVKAYMIDQMDDLGTDGKKYGGEDAIIDEFMRIMQPTLQEDGIEITGIPEKNEDTKEKDDKSDEASSPDMKTIPDQNGGALEELGKATYQSDFRNKDLGVWSTLLWNKWASKDPNVSKAFKNKKQNLLDALINLDQKKKKSINKAALDVLIPKLKAMTQKPEIFDKTWARIVSQDMKGIANFYNMRDRTDFEGQMQDRVPGEAGSIGVQAIANKRLKALGLEDRQIEKVRGLIYKFLNKHVKDKKIKINEAKFLKHLDIILEKYNVL